MYANSRFAIEINEWGRVEKWIEPGDKISQNDIGVNDVEWKSLIDRGIVVENYPKGLDPQTPPAEYYRNNPPEAEMEEEKTTSAPAKVPEEDSGKKPPWEK